MYPFMTGFYFTVIFYYVMLTPHEKLHAWVLYPTKVYVVKRIYFSVPQSFGPFCLRSLLFPV